MKNGIAHWADCRIVSLDQKTAEQHKEDKKALSARQSLKFSAYRLKHENLL